MLNKNRAVQYELLRPAEVKLLRERCPVVYIPVGSLEWHGVHNPLGTDGLKAHAICCEAALRYGGVVLPTLFLGILGDGRGWGRRDGVDIQSLPTISGVWKKLFSEWRSVSLPMTGKFWSA